MVLLLYLQQKTVFNHNQRLFGDKQINIMYQDLLTLIKWILLVQIFIM